MMAAWLPMTTVRQAPLTGTPLDLLHATAKLELTDSESNLSDSHGESSSPWCIRRRLHGAGTDIKDSVSSAQLTDMDL